MDPEGILTIVREITVTGLLALGIWGLVTGRVVTRFHYDEMKRKYRDELAEALGLLRKAHERERARRN